MSIEVARTYLAYPSCTYITVLLKRTSALLSIWSFEYRCHLHDTTIQDLLVSDVSTKSVFPTAATSGARSQNISLNISKFLKPIITVLIHCLVPYLSHGLYLGFQPKTGVA